MDTDPIARWHAIVEAGDLAGLEALLDDEVVFLSPVMHTPQRGKSLTAMYLAAAYRVLVNEHFRYVAEARGERHAVLEFVTELDGVEINGVDILWWNDAGRLVEFKVMVRPLKAIETLRARMLALLGAGGKPGAGD